ncbi:hypothetical protein [Nocardia yamanashiensis]|uniref:hypothetical protein n=1 Tax=Nocardia yamanashiensis TaxID=209247 RepID=UPI00082E0B50|nr:hypothetical protein [Nocardia yamanashiensis]
MSESTMLALSAKLDRLFDAFRLRGTTPQTEDDVARSVTAKLGKAVPASEIRRMRAGGSEGASPSDPAVLAAIADHFGVPAAYLLDSAGDAVQATDKWVRMIAAARDAGVRGLALRGDAIDHDELAELFAKVIARRKPTAGQDKTA